VGVGVLAAKAIVSRLQLCSRPPAISAVWCGGRLASAPKAAGIDHRNCREGATTPPHRPRWGKARTGRDRRGLEFTITSLAADHAVAIPRKRAGRHFGADLGNDQGPSTNSFSSPAVMRLWRDCNLASAAGEAW